jgi:hypothetical protein
MINYVIASAANYCLISGKFLWEVRLICVKIIKLLKQRLRDALYI